MIPVINKHISAMIIRTRDEVGVAMAETNRSYAAGLPHSCKGSLVLCWLSDPFP